MYLYDLSFTYIYLLLNSAKYGIGHAGLNNFDADGGKFCFTSGQTPCCCVKSDRATRPDSLRVWPLFQLGKHFSSAHLFHEFYICGF